MYSSELFYLFKKQIDNHLSHRILPSRIQSIQVPKHALTRPDILLSDPHVPPKTQNTQSDWMGKKPGTDPIRHT